MILPLNTLNHFADQWLPGPEVLYSIIFGWTFLPRHCTFVFCTCANFSHPQPPTAQRPTFYETSTSSSLLEQSSYESALMTFMLILAKNCHLLVSFPCLSGLYNHLSSDPSFSGCWTLSDLVQKLFHWPFSKYSWSSPFISSESCTWYWSEMHQRVEKVAPGHSVYLSISFPVWLFLKVHLLFLTTVQTVVQSSDSSSELSSLPIELIKFICDNSGLIIIFILCWLSINQHTHVSSEFADRLPEDAFKKPEHILWI